MASERAIQDDETIDIGVKIQNGRVESVADCATVAAILDREMLWWKGHCVEGADELVAVCEGLIGTSGKTEVVSLPSNADTEPFS